MKFLCKSLAIPKTVDMIQAESQEKQVRVQENLK